MEPQRYWFPAKRYGWGWGLPCTWEGWLVLATFVGLIVMGAVLFPPTASLFAYLVYLGTVVALFFNRVLAKGRAAASAMGNDQRYSRP